MRIPRIYLPAPLQTGTSVELDERSRRHAVQVLRLQAGDEIILFNGDGHAYKATLRDANKRSANADVQSDYTLDTESPLNITLVQGVSRGERMDFTIQKSVELGVQCIQPLWTERSQVNLSGQRLTKRIEHWQGVAIAACEQSGRNHIPEVMAPTTLTQWLTETDPDSLNLLLDPENPQSLDPLKPVTGQPLYMLAGPEGGLNQKEKALATAAGYCGVRLGPRILRTETAAVVALSVLQWKWGDLS